MKLAAIAFLLFVLSPPTAQSQPESLRVATRVIKPFVIEEGGSLTGFSIELWQEISALLDLRTQYIVKPSVRDLLEATRSNEADLAIAAISITEEREKNWDFSQPMFDAGLQILVPDQDDGGNDIARIASAILNPSWLPILGLVLLGVAIAGHVVWLLERRQSDGLLPKRAYFPGIFEACWWAASTLATQADQMPKSAAARMVAVFWMYSAVLFIAFFTAAVTSTLTVQQLRGDIQGPDDLPGKRVATVRNSTSAEYLARRGIEAMEFTSVDEANQVLLKGDADAVVYDSPVLLYFASHEGKGKVQVVGSIFRKESYGILFPSESPHRKPVNEALLRLRENGTYDRIYAKWFGADGARRGS
jgi:polar amino acid transport system substrate-binding protein